MLVMVILVEEMGVDLILGKRGDRDGDVCTPSAVNNAELHARTRHFFRLIFFGQSAVAIYHEGTPVPPLSE